MTGSFEAYMINRWIGRPCTEFEGTFNAEYVVKFVAEARVEGYTVENHTDMTPAFVRVVFEAQDGTPWVYREFYPVAAPEELPA